MNATSETKSTTPLRDRRRKATQRFTLRVVVLSALIAGIVYTAWLAPWARPVRDVPVERVR